MEVLVLYELRLGADRTAVKGLLEAEARQSWKTLQSGVLREVKGRLDRPGAVARLEVASVEEAVEHIAALPLVKAGLLDYQVIPLTYYATYEALFREKV